MDIGDIKQKYIPTQTHYDGHCKHYLPFFTENNDDRCVTTRTPTPFPSLQPSQPPTQPPTQTITPTTTTGPPGPAGDVSAAAIAGVVIGGLIAASLVVFIITIIAYLCWRKKNSPRKCITIVLTCSVYTSKQRSENLTVTRNQAQAWLFT